MVGLADVLIKIWMLYGGEASSTTSGGMTLFRQEVMINHFWLVSLDPVEHIEVRRLDSDNGVSEH